ncbi:hypothetical protein [Streptomyces sp. BK340]|uniref:hypothetical protein n=1 Tax=Streptomyces sp. BK340 TaxID=2572903 RepID=UPI0011A20EEA|nr:hypothetical protein [Streptomyces sp. BK340]TVZ77488.1 hypothetical protein FB157_13812 [Streptomyces sp. BK340]
MAVIAGFDNEGGVTSVTLDRLPQLTPNPPLDPLRKGAGSRPAVREAGTRQQHLHRPRHRARLPGLTA